jgi:hypothetical protein
MNQTSKHEVEMEKKPEMVGVIGIIMIVSGVLNILAGLVWTLIIVIGTLGIGLLCAPLTLIPIGIGIYEVIQGANVLGNKPVKNVTLVGILEITSILWGNILSVIGGILVLIFYNDEEVKAYLDGMV